MMPSCFHSYNCKPYNVHKSANVYKYYIDTVCNTGKVRGSQKMQSSLLQIKMLSSYLMGKIHKNKCHGQLIHQHLSKKSDGSADHSKAYILL